MSTRSTGPSSPVYECLLQSESGNAEPSADPPSPAAAPPTALRTPTPDWVSRMADALRADTADEVLHSLGAALFLLIGARKVEISWTGATEQILGQWQCDAATELRNSTSVWSQSALSAARRESKIYGTATVLLEDNHVLRVHLPVESTGAAGCGGSQALPIRPLLLVAIERCWALAPFRRASAGKTQLSSPSIAVVCRNLATCPLSAREVEVLHSMLQGLAAKTIARQLTISPGTVRIHIRHIYAKLKVASQAQLLSLFIHPPETLPGRTSVTKHCGDHAAQPSMVQKTRPRLGSSEH